LIKKYQIKNLNKKQKIKLKRVVKEYNIIFSEWFLHYTVFLSKIVNPKKQKLFVRLHRCEILKKFIFEANWKNITKVIFINPYIENIVKSKIKASINKTCVIHNYINYPKIDEEILNNDETKFNICMVGYVPKLKRPDIAINIYRELKKYDSKYNLYLIGKSINFVRKKPVEMEYYKTKIINQSDINILPYNSNLSNFYNKMGHILICSDVESFHVSSHEALSYGVYSYYVGNCLNYISNIIPNEFQFKNIDSVVNKIVENNNNFSKEDNRKMYENYLEKYKLSKIAYNIFELITK